MVATITSRLEPRRRLQRQTTGVARPLNTLSHMSMFVAVAVVILCQLNVNVAGQPIIENEQKKLAARV